MTARPFASLLVAAALLASSQALGAAPDFLPLQGVLTDADGAPIDAPVQVRFSLFAQENEGSALWTETQQLAPERGLFTAYLGQQSPLDLATFASHDALWLEVTVGEDAPMTRLPLGSTPFAGFAQHCGSVPDHSHALSELSGTLDPAAFPAGVVQGPQSCPAGEQLVGLDADGRLICQSAVSVAWDSISGRPAEFPAAAHTHPGSDVTSAVAHAEEAANALALEGSPAAAFARAEHAHSTLVASGTQTPTLSAAANGDVTVRGASLSLWNGDKAVTLRQDGSNTWLSNKANFVNNGAAANGSLTLNGEAGVRLSVGATGDAGQVGLRLSPGAASPNLNAGHPDNAVGAGVSGVTIAGGGKAENWSNSTLERNLATDDYCAVGGGWGNQAGDNTGTSSTATAATVGGGLRNTASSEGATVAGGNGNRATAWSTAIGGGYLNSATGDYATVCGGYQNAASGVRATVPGGTGNSASGAASMAAGTGALATHERSYVWNGGTSPMASNGIGQYVVNAPGGVGINTNVTGANALSVNGSASVSGGLAVAGALTSGNLRVQRVIDLTMGDTGLTTLASVTFSSTGSPYLILASVQCDSGFDTTTVSMYLDFGTGNFYQHRYIYGAYPQTVSIMWLEHFGPGTRTVMLRGLATGPSACKGTFIVLAL